jgi:hypothetical protein
MVASVLLGRISTLFLKGELQMNGMTHDATDPSSPTPPANPGATLAPAPGELNIIFRGLYLFVQRKKIIDVLLPNMQAEHTYRAGLFMAEVPLASAAMGNPYILQGVIPGGGAFPGGSNPILQGYDYRSGLTQDEVFARLVLPLPDQILALRPTQDPVKATDPTGHIDGQRFPGIYVFHYRSNDLNTVRLGDHVLPEGPGIHQFPGKPKSFMNLHIINEPEVGATNMDHPAHAFQQTIDLVQGLQGIVKLDKNQKTDLSAASGDFSSVGFGLIETQEYCACRSIHLEAGQKWRLKVSFLPPESGLLDSPPNDCLSLVLSPG